MLAPKSGREVAIKKILAAVTAAVDGHREGAEVYGYIARGTTRLNVTIDDDSIIIEPVEAALPNLILIMIRKPLNRFFGSEAFLS